MPFSILPYSIDNLVGLLAKSANTSSELINLKQHKSYLERYFTTLGAMTILAEGDYIDHDYLEDYSSYYVKCFHDYNRKCTRLHFFQVAFTRDDFVKVISAEDASLLQRIKDTYLGFVVVKPLPKTVIGRTCLKTYPCEDKRFYPITRDYSANLFGINLSVKTLAYQEQDAVVAACATSALWSVFHGTGMLFHHAIPSPIEITKAAIEKSPAEKRNFPNAGLSLEQLGHAIRDVGLDPLLVKATNEYILKSTAYGYIHSGVPIYLSITLYDTSTSPHMYIGRHGVAMTGYRLSSTKPKPMDSTGFLLKSSRIEKIYVHDDQVGPFARMEFDNGTVVEKDDANNDVHLASIASSWFNDAGRAIPNAILIPLYHKIRIPYEVAHDIVLDFDCLLEVDRANFLQILPDRLEWDIFLSQINGFKREIIESKNLSGKSKEKILTTKLPKYIWRAIGSINGNPMLEFVFDATDIEQGNVFITCVDYDNNLYNFLIIISKLPVIQQRATKSIPIFNWFASQTI